MTVAYESLQDILENAGLPTSAAEAHGALCGLLCAGKHDSGALLAILGETDEDDSLREAITALQAETHAALEEGSLAFTLLMPGEDMPAALRSRALIGWCRGFVAGAGRQSLPVTTDEAAEALADIAAVADAAGTVGDSDLEELLEYLRVGVQLLYEECNPPDPAS